MARDILAVLSNDLGEGFVRIINTATGEAQQPIKVDGGGVRSHLLSVIAREQA